MPKKTIIIFIVVFIFVGSGIWAGYYYFGNNQNSSTTTNGSTTIGNQTFNPFGTGTTTNTNTSTNTDTPTTDTTGDTPVVKADSMFHQITDFAISGATYFEDTKPIVTTTTDTTVTAPVTTPTTTTKTTKKVVVKKVETPKFEIIPSLRYVEKANGHIYQRNISTKESTKISNSTIPSIYEALFNSDASTVIYRYLSSDGATISSYVASLGGAKGEFLASNILDISVSPDKNSFFYLIKNSNGISGVTKSFKETKSNSVWTSPYTEWLSQWVSPQKVFLTTKASWSYQGSLFSLNTSNGTMTKIFGGVSGLTTLANTDATLVLYNTSTNTGPKLEVFDINKHKVEDLDVYGLPEKCIWSNDKISIYCALPKVITGTQYPDSWYQGIISFDDYFVKIDTNTNTISTIADSTEGTSVDATQLFLDKEEKKLFFTNKKDSTLWSLDIN